MEKIERKSLVFEEAFGTVSYSSKLRLDFSNPMKEEFMSAKVGWAMRGAASAVLLNSMDFAILLNVEQLKVVEFKPFFFTDTTLKEFRTVFDGLAQKMISVINQKLSMGIPLPIGTGMKSSLAGEKKVHVKKDMIVTEVGGFDISPILKISKFDPATQQEQIQAYPDLQEIVG